MTPANRRGGRGPGSCDRGPRSQPSQATPDPAEASGTRRPSTVTVSRVPGVQASHGTRPLPFPHRACSGPDNAPTVPTHCPSLTSRLKNNLFWCLPHHPLRTTCCAPATPLPLRTSAPSATDPALCTTLSDRPDVNALRAQAVTSHNAKGTQALNVRAGTDSGTRTPVISVARSVLASEPRQLPSLAPARPGL